MIFTIRSPSIKPLNSLCLLFCKIKDGMERLQHCKELYIYYSFSYLKFTKPYNSRCIEKKWSQFSSSLSQWDFLLTLYRITSVPHSLNRGEPGDLLLTTEITDITVCLDSSSGLWVLLFFQKDSKGKRKGSQIKVERSCKVEIENPSWGYPRQASVQMTY